MQNVTLFKTKPKSNRLYRSSVKLPALSTLRNCLGSIPFNAGINQYLISKLKTRVKKMSQLDKFYSLMFDEIAISLDLVYCSDADKIVWKV